MDRPALQRLLRDIQAGKIDAVIVYKIDRFSPTEIHAGEHAAIVDADVWQQVQVLLGRNGSTGGPPVHNQFGALLKGLLRCGPCGCAMTPSYATKKGTKPYRYYVCSSAQKRGWGICPSPSIPAGSAADPVRTQAAPLRVQTDGGPRKTFPNERDAFPGTLLALHGNPSARSWDRE
jgi:hypothetical protein